MASMSPASSLTPLLAPRSIAVIGASDNVGRPGGRPIQRLLAAGFAGPIYPVNPNRREVQGLTAYPGIAEVPGPVDCAVIAVAADLVPDAVEACAAKGVKAAVVFTAGFAEAGEAGQAAQRRMGEVARASGMRIVGPNCLGVFSVAARSYLTFTSLFQETVTPGRSVGLVSQSGGYGSHVLKLAQNRNLTIGKFVTTGNEVDVEFGEVLAAFAEDPSVNVILAYIEGVRSREGLLAGLEAAQRNRKPVVVLKVGRTEAGAAAAASHTASLAGSDAVYDAIFNDYGVWRADSMEEALDVVYAASWGHLPEPGLLCAITASGGIGVQMADVAAASGQPLRDPPPDVRRAILEAVPLGSAHNPIDLLGTMLGDIDSVATVMDRLLAATDYRAFYTFIGINGLLPALTDPYIDLLARLREAHPDRLFAVSAVAHPDTVARFEAIGVPVFEDPGRGMRALAALGHFARAFARPLPSRVADPQPAAPPLPPGRRFDEAEGKAVLAGLGIGVPRERIAADATSAARAAVEIGFPVAVKVLSADIVHKTDVGGVSLGLADAGAVVRAVDGMAASVAARAPDATVAGWLVGEMVPAGVECIVGVHRDPLFGPVVMVGLGGVMVELMKDVTVRLAPVSADEALEMVRGLRGFPLLNGFRGRPAADVGALADAIAAVSRLAAANAGHLRTLEINPLLVMPDGNGCIALDAVIETTSSAE